MAYCTATDVQGEFKDITFSTTTAVKTAQVEEFISQTDAEINARVGLLYVVPVTGTESLKILKMICLGIVATRIRNILTVKSGVEKVDQGSKSEGTDPYRKMLKMIVDGDMLLSDATRLQSGNGVASGAIAASCEPHVFRKNEDQW